MPEHADLTGTDLHEPKGADTATANTVYIADGVGSGAWAKIGSANIDTTSVFNANKVYLTCDITDVSTAESVYIYIPFNGTVDKVSSVLQGAITVADSIVTCYNHAGASMGTLTIAFTGSAAGDIDSLTPVSNNTFTNGQRMRIATDGASTTAARLFLTIEFTVTG